MLILEPVASISITPLRYFLVENGIVELGNEFGIDWMKFRTSFMLAHGFIWSQQHIRPAIIGAATDVPPDSFVKDLEKVFLL